MRRVGVLSAIGLVLIFCTSATAFDLQKGIHGMQWDSSVSQHKNLTRVKVLGNATYYANSSMVYETANQPVPAVYYGFYQDRFFAAFVKLRSPNQFSHLKRQFMQKYGEPKSTRNASGLTVYRWRDRNVIIKLKLRESPVEYKMAMYYRPLASWFNQTQLENAAPDTPSQKSGGNQDSNPTPLIGY